MADRRNERYERGPSRDYDQDYNPQTNYGAREENYARQGGRQEHNRFNRNQPWTGADEMDEGQDPNRRYEPYRRDDWGREPGSGVSGSGDRGSFQADQGYDSAHGPGGTHDSGRGNWGGISAYGSGVSGYSAVGPYSSAGFGGSYAGMGGYGAGYSGGMGYYGRRAQGPHAGRGPKGYRRSDDRIREDVNERLTEHPQIDATEIEVTLRTARSPCPGPWTTVAPSVWPRTSPKA